MVGVDFSMAFNAGALMNILKIFLSIAGTIIMLFVSIIIWKNNRYVYPVLVVRGSGLGKVVLEHTKAGKFKKGKVFFNLIDLRGEYELVTKKNQIIANFSDQDMHDINGKKGFIVVQKPDDQKILVPISLTRLENMNLIMKIAPADFRDVAVQLKNRSEKEMMSSMETFLPYISIMIVGVIAFLIFVVTFQFVSGTLGTLADKCSSVVHTVTAPLPSSAP